MYVVRNSGTTDNKLAASQAFLTYVRGIKGQQILEENYFYNHFDQPNEVDVPFPPGFAPISEPNRQICRTVAGTTVLR